MFRECEYMLKVDQIGKQNSYVNSVYHLDQKPQVPVIIADILFIIYVYIYICIYIYIIGLVPSLKLQEIFNQLGFFKLYVTYTHLKPKCLNKKGNLLAHVTKKSKGRLQFQLDWDSKDVLGTKSYFLRSACFCLLSLCQYTFQYMMTKERK